MGLDMFLQGHKFLWNDWDNPENNRTEDGIKIETIIVKLGYWRKHPNLHGFIVQEFGPKDKSTGEPLDDCEPIELYKEDLEKIIEAVKGKSLPATKGLFFGRSYNTPEEQAEDLKILSDALEWLEAGDSGPQRISRNVKYQASW